MLAKSVKRFCTVVPVQCTQYIAMYYCTALLFFSAETETEFDRLHERVFAVVGH